ncbi:hypothetical protein [Microtetraspora malaysiensis]
MTAGGVRHARCEALRLRVGGPSLYRNLFRRRIDLLDCVAAVLERW